MENKSAAGVERAELANRERWRKRNAQRFPANTTPPPLVPRRVWEMCWRVQADRSGAAVCAEFARLRRSHSGAPIWAIIRAALGVTDDGEAKLWADDRARAIAALGLFLCEVSKLTRRRSRWRRCVRGYSVDTLRAALRSPFTGETPGRSALSGTHRAEEARRRFTECGYLRALEEAGFMYSQQLPAGCVESWEIGGNTGRAFNRYWIVGLSADVSMLESVELHAWHDGGWAAGDMPPQSQAPP